MILPTKHLDERRTLAFLGAQVLQLLVEPLPLTSLWDRYKRSRLGSWKGEAAITFDWFVLSVDFLYAIGAIELEDGRLTRR